MRLTSGIRGCRYLFSIPCFATLEGRFGKNIKRLVRKSVDEHKMFCVMPKGHEGNHHVEISCGYKHDWENPEEQYEDSETDKGRIADL